MLVKINKTKANNGCNLVEFNVDSYTQQDESTIIFTVGELKITAKLTIGGFYRVFQISKNKKVLGNDDFLTAAKEIVKFYK